MNKKGRTFWTEQEEASLKRGWNNREPGISKTEFARKWGEINGKSCNSVRCKLDELFQDESSNPDKCEFGTDDIHIVCSSPRIKCEADIIREFKIDTHIWKLTLFRVKTSEGYRKDREVSWHVRDGNVTSGDVEDTGRILVVPMFHTEARFVRKNPEDVTLDDIQDIFTKLPARSSLHIKKPPKASAELLEIDVADLHFGNKSYLSSLSDNVVDRFENMVSDIVGRVRGKSIERIAFVPIGDVFHYDNETKKTSSGTQMDSASGQSAYEVFDMAFRCISWGIEQLVEIAPVSLYYIGGNHDRMAGYYLIKALEAYFRKCKGVEVDASHATRKWIRYGKNLIAWMHGDLEKTRAASWLQNEARKEWGETLYAEIHAGHIHTQTTQENNGVILRYLPATTSPDQWHYDHGYLGNVRSTASFVWHKDRGLVEQWFTNV